MPKDVTFYLGPANAKRSWRLILWNVTVPAIRDLYTDQTIAGTEESITVPMPDDHVFEMELTQTVAGRTRRVRTQRFDTTLAVFKRKNLPPSLPPLPGDLLFADGELYNSSSSSSTSTQSSITETTPTTFTLTQTLFSTSTASSLSSSSSTDLLQLSTSSQTNSTSSTMSSSSTSSLSTLSSRTLIFTSFTRSELSSSSFRFWV